MFLLQNGLPNLNIHIKFALIKLDKVSIKNKLVQYGLKIRMTVDFTMTIKMVK